MSFRGRSFRPRSSNRPPRSGRGGERGRPPGPGVRGNFRFPGPESYAGRDAPSSHQERNERSGFEERDRFRRARSPDEDFCTRSHARDYADHSSGPYRGGNSSYYGHRTTNTIDYDHRGMKTASNDDPGNMDSWSREPFTEQRHYDTGRHHPPDKPKAAAPAIEADQPSKVVAVEKAVEMAQRTRDIISKLGGFKQMSQQDSSSFTNTSAQPSNADFSYPKTWSSETNAVAAKAPADSAAIDKIRQNTSLVQYAFNLPVEPESRSESVPSLPSRDVSSSWTGASQKYSDVTFKTADHTREAGNYAVTNVTASAGYQDNMTTYSQQQSAWNEAPKVAPEPPAPPKVAQKTDSCDPTIANILKSIGFNFELSNMMQDKARKESTSSVGQNTSAESSTQANRVPSVYEERANKYRAEQMRQYGTYEPLSEEPPHAAVDSSADKSSLKLLQRSYNDKPVAEDMFTDMFKETPPVDFKLKFKGPETDAGKKSSTLYEDFSDSDDDFTATAKTNADAENKSNIGLVSQNVPFGREGIPQQVTPSKTADDLDWELSTEVFIRKLQQPREELQPQLARTVTVVPKSEPPARNVTLSTVQSERDDDDALDVTGDNFKLAKSVVPLEELKTIRKTIIVSESPVRSESGAGKLDSASKNVKNFTNREKTPKSQQREEGVSKSKDRDSVDSGHKKKRASDAEERDPGSKAQKLDAKEKQKRIEALQKELENLRRQQNILMRRRKREKDVHKDPFLMENSKLQEEICTQINKLRAASMQAQENSRSQTSDQLRSKDESETETRSQARSSRGSSRSVSPEGRDNRQSRSKSAARNTDGASDRQPRFKRIDVNYEYFDGGNHFCRCCNVFSINIFEHCQHLISSSHQQNVDPFDKPWLKLAAKTPAKPAGTKGRVTSARIRGVEFLMSTQAFYCSLCDVFLGSCTCAETHCKSDEHNEKYAKYQDDNPYYERRLELEKNSSSAVTGKPLPSSVQRPRSPSSSRSSRKDDPLTVALEKAKVQVQQMVKKRQQEEASMDPDAEPLYPTFKKSRVVPKSSGVLQSEDLSSRRLEGNSPSAESDSRKKSEDDVDSGGLRDAADATEGAVSSQKNDVDPPEATSNKAKKSLPFIGKLPFLKAARTAKQSSASEQSSAEDKSKIEIKLNVGHAVSTSVQSGLTPSSSDVERNTAQVVQVAPNWPAGSTRSAVESSSTADLNSLDAFLSIGDPESGQSQAVPVLNIGPQTRSEVVLENQPDGTKALSKVAASPANNNADVKATVTDEVAKDVKPSTTVPSGNSSNDVMSMSVAQTHSTQITPVSDSHGAADDTQCNDPEDDSAMFIDIDDNTEDYEPNDNAEGDEQAAQLPRNEETTQLLPQISATWMQPSASSVANDEDTAAAGGDEEAEVMSDEYEFLDECGADDD